MRISLLISMLLLVFATALNAQTSNHRHSNNESLWEDEPASADGTFIFSYGTNKKDTTFELIDCPDKNGVHQHQKIDIYWENGIPRRGIVTDCSKKRHNIKYFLTNYSPKGSAKTITVNPRVMSDRMELFANYPVNVIIMDVTTGEMVHTSLETPTSGTYTHHSDTTIVHTEQGETEPSGFFHMRAIDMPTEGSKPKVVDYSHLDNGLYFMLVIDDRSKELMFLKTFRKGIK